MAQANNISIEIPDSVIDKVTEYLKATADLLRPYLVGLPDEDKDKFAKMKDKSFTFVDKALEYCESNEEYAPKFLDIPELKKDLGAWKALRPVWNEVNNLWSNLDDTMLLLGSDAFTGARYYYNAVSFAASEGNASAKPIAEELGKRFAPQGKRKAKP